MILLQVTPPPVQREIFHLLLYFWDRTTTPDSWNEVLLHLIEKKMDKATEPSNFRPIGLIEILRKVWSKMLMNRVMPIMAKFATLQSNHYAFLPGRGTANELLQLLNVLEEVIENGL